MKTSRILSAALVTVLAVAGCHGGGNSNDGQIQNPGIKAAAGSSTAVLPAADTTAKAIESDENVPTIKFLSKGSILPTSGSTDLLFGSISYAGARVRVKKVYQSNILQFLQFYDWESRSELYKVADLVADTTIVLGDPSADHLREFKTYGLSMDELVKPEPGAIYHVEICGTNPLVEEDYWYDEDCFGDYETYEERSVDLLASNLALIVKSADNGFDAFTFNIISGKPVSGAKVKLYSFAQQELGKGVTDKEGHVHFATTADARFVTANAGNDFSYIALSYGKSLSTSNFNVSGSDFEGGIKAYVFGERGVWRPGDTLHVSAIAMLDGIKLPEGHPVTAELRNPDGQVAQTITVKGGSSSIYHFPFVTEKDAPTGRWQACVTIGGQSFYKTLRVETVKPNKLDIDLKFDNPIITPEPTCSGIISVNWLYGAPGANLTIDADLDLAKTSTSFKGYEAYDFIDNAREFDGQSFTYGKMSTDEDGLHGIGTGMDLDKDSIQGMLEATFTIRAYEPSGEFSTGVQSFKLSPFPTYVGIKTDMDHDNWGDSYLQAGTSHKFDVATVNAEGEPVNASSLKAEIYHVDWSWWWNASSEIASYMAGSSKERVFKKTISTSGGKGSFSYDWADAPEGVYYIRVTDENGRHATSMICDVYREKPTAEGADGATMLSLQLDKDSYKAGETARLNIPSSEGSCALVSLEKGGKVLSTSQVNCYNGSTEIQIPLTKDMLPNVYAFVTLIQPHGNTLNDAPIRMYGVANINVEDASSHLNPKIEIAETVKPESTLKFKVKEQNGKPMSYVVALVDEGLLSLTNFKTPDAWKAFYAKEALRVRTWDVYDNVIGAYGGHIEQLFAIGGDEEAEGVLKRKGADRFTPVVAYLGPFELKAGKTATHSYEVPQYIGSLRAMVIASDGKAQGSCQQNVNVTKPVMVQATLPRTLAVGERIKVPATLITLEDGVGEVKLGIKADGMFKVTGPETIKVNSEKAGQSVEYFELEVGAKTGIGHVTVTAKSSTDDSKSDVEIDIFNPNSPVTRLQSVLLAAGESKDIQAEMTGIDGSNSLSVEFSSIPAINLDGRMRYLTSYPYGCIEQTVSGAFPQLFLDKLTDCDKNTTALCARNVTSAINRMQSFRCSDGSLSYWPGTGRTSTFGTVYALHFLQEAENCGYAVPQDLKAGLVKAAGEIAQNKKEGAMVRAYGLYALAVAGKPQRSTMNNMREKMNDFPNSAKWMLAAAYACDGKKNVAQKITAGLPYTETKDSYYWEYYGSKDRNMALALKSSILCDQQTQAFDIAASIAQSLGDGSHYMSTQSTAWCLYAMAGYAGSISSDGIDASVKTAGKTQKMTTSKSMVKKELIDGADPDKIPLTLANSGSAPVHAVIACTGIPAAGEEKALSSKLKMSIKYVDEKGAEIAVDTLSRGRSFKAVVTITSTGSEAATDLALSQRFPSGWEIINDRVYKTDVSYPAGINYQDFRDDRVYSFFDLSAGSSVTVTTKLTATYPGMFYLPAVNCEAMYDSSIAASVPGKWIEVK